MCRRRWSLCAVGGSVSDPDGAGDGGGPLICRCSRVLHGGAGGDGGPCTRVGSLRTDLGENLPSASAKARGGGAICVVPFLKASPRRSSRPLSATSGGNPRSDDGGALVSFLPWGRHSWTYTRDRWTRGWILWWCGGSSYTLMATCFDGAALWIYGVR